jgi:hypothetical protein
LERIISSFFFEGRNSLTTRSGKLYIGYQHPHVGRREARLEEAEYLSFHEWVDWMRTAPPTYPEDFRRNRVENSVDNYYIRTLTHRHRPDLDAPIGPDGACMRACFHDAFSSRPFLGPFVRRGQP